MRVYMCIHLLFSLYYCLSPSFFPALSLYVYIYAACMHILTEAQRGLEFCEFQLLDVVAGK